jgi:subtilisin family serine protease
MVGGDGAGPFAFDIGLAYNARVISAKVLDANNSFSSASIVIAGAQWMLDPDGNPQTDDFPHVVNNSWYFFDPTYTGFHASMQAWQAAGIIPVFAIGGFGPGASTTRPPANYNNTIGVGATDLSDVIAVFSSRGPSPAGAAFPADQRKPELSAPGVAVRSSVPGGAYEDWSGTSMSTPHVAATAALMIELSPSLTYDEIRQVLLETSVDLGAAGYDHSYGYGRLDAFEAITRVAATLAMADPEATVPAGLQLIAGPNPFRDRVRFDFEGVKGAAPMLSIFDVGGRLVRSFRVASDSSSLLWDGRDGRGRAVAQGVYLARLSLRGDAATRRLLCVR